VDGAVFEYYQEREDHTLTMAEDAMDVEMALNSRSEEQVVLFRTTRPGTDQGEMFREK